MVNFHNHSMFRRQLEFLRNVRLSHLLMYFLFVWLRLSRLTEGVMFSTCPFVHSSVRPSVPAGTVRFIGSLEYVKTDINV